MDLPLYNGLFLNTVISVSDAVNTHLLKVGGLGFWGAEACPYLGFDPPQGCKVSVKMLSRHEKHPCAKGDLVEESSSTARSYPLKGAAVMTCPHCAASSGAEPCHFDAAFRLGLQVPQMQGGAGGGDHRLRVTLVTLEHRDRIGPLTGLV